MRNGRNIMERVFFATAVAAILMATEGGAQTPIPTLPPLPPLPAASETSTPAAPVTQPPAASVTQPPAAPSLTPATYTLELLFPEGVVAVDEMLLQLPE